MSEWKPRKGDIVRYERGVWKLAERTSPGNWTLDPVDVSGSTYSVGGGAVICLPVPGAGVTLVERAPAKVRQFKVGDIVRRTYEPGFHYTFTVTNPPPTERGYVNGVVLDPGPAGGTGRWGCATPGTEVTAPLGACVLLERPTVKKSARIRQLEEKLAQADLDFEQAQANVRQLNRRYGKASATIGELRSVNARLREQLTDYATQLEELKPPIVEPVKQFTVGTTWSTGDPEPDLPVGSKVQVGPSKLRRALRANGWCCLNGCMEDGDCIYPDRWSRLTAYGLVTLTEIGEG